MPPPEPETSPPRLLLDEHVSRRRVEALADVFPGARHVVPEGLGAAPDEAVWEYARERGLVIVTTDADFHQRSFLYGAPPKVVWLRLGNCTTDDIATLLREHAGAIAAFVEDADSALLELR